MSVNAERSICLADNCSCYKLHAKGLCKKHYEINRKYGSPNLRTRQDRNEIIECLDYAEIVLYDRHSKEITRTIIDKADVASVREYKWHISNELNYVAACIDGSKMFLHRFLLGVQDDHFVDHVNHNVLDNRKSNLRICTPTGNAINKGLSRNNTSGYPGVTWHKGKNKWMASVQINYKVKHLGYFDSISTAIQARIKGELKYFGKFAPVLSGVWPNAVQM